MLLDLTVGAYKDKDSINLWREGKTILFFFLCDAPNLAKNKIIYSFNQFIAPNIALNYTCESISIQQGPVVQSSLPNERSGVM